MILRGDAEPAQALAVEKTAGRVFARYLELFEIEAKDLPVLTLELEDGEGAYDPSDHPALYQRSGGRIHFRRRPDPMLLLHEIAHHFIYATLGDVPVWFNEGLATYLGWSAMDDSRLVVGEIPVAHFRTLQSLARQDALIPLAHFLALDGGEFYLPDRCASHYAEAWGLVYFLLHAKLPRNLGFRDKLARIRSMPADELCGLQEAFFRFSREFSLVQALTERLASRDALRRMSSAFRLGLTRDAKAAGELLRLALDERAEERLRRTALTSGALAALASGEESARALLGRTLRDLRERPSPGMLRDEAEALSDALRRDDREAVAARFAELNKDCTFYPAAGFL